MVDRILSQEEIDALMQGVSAGQVETESDLNGELAEVDEYNLITSKERVVHGKLPAMEIINNRFCGLFKETLFNFVRKVVDVTVEEIALMQYSEYIRKVNLPASFNIFKISPLKGFSLLIFDAELVFVVVNNYFGGTTKALNPIEKRDFTNFEQRIIRKMLEEVFIDMRVAWEPVLPLEFIFNRSELNPRFVNVVMPTEMVIVSTFQIEIEGRSSQMSICIPYSSLGGALQEKLYASCQSDKTGVDTGWSVTFIDELRRSRLPVTGEIGKRELPIGDFLSLEIDDVIMLDNKISEPVVVKVEGVPKFLGSLGKRKGSYSVKIEKFIDKGGE
jgi:flagellar motor switch protein FliM